MHRSLSLRVLSNQSIVYCIATTQQHLSLQLLTPVLAPPAEHPQAHPIIQPSIHKPTQSSIQPPGTAASHNLTSPYLGAPLSGPSAHQHPHIRICPAHPTHPFTFPRTRKPLAISRKDAGKLHCIRRWRTIRGKLHRRRRAGATFPTPRARARIAEALPPLSWRSSTAPTQDYLTQDLLLRVFGCVDRR